MNADGHASGRGGATQGSRRLQAIRKAIVQSATTAGLPVECASYYDRIGPVRVIHEQDATRIFWGELKLETVRERSVENITARIFNRVKAIEEKHFDFLQFERDFRNALNGARDSTRKGDQVRIDEVYREFRPDKRRYFDLDDAAGEQEQKLHSTFYSLVDFLVDFALFRKEMDDGQSSEYDHLVVAELSLEESDQAYLVPDLSDPLRSEKPVLYVELIADSDY